MVNVVPHIGPGVQGHLNLMPAEMLPETVVGDIFTKAKSQSTVMQLGQQVPVGINETTVTVSGTFPEAGQVGGTTLASREGGVKPVAGLQYGSQKSFMPIKLAVIVTVSREYALTNPEGYYTQLTTQLSRAIARAADLAVVHGRDALRGTTLNGISNNSYLNATTNRVELDLSGSASPDLVAQILEGWNMVVSEDNGPGNLDFNALAVAPSVRPAVVTARDDDGQRLYIPGNAAGNGFDINVNDSFGSLLGIPVTFATSVTGRLGQSADTGVRMIGGDFSQLAWGYADAISVRISDQASLDNGSGGVINLWQTNQIAVLAEATFGWYVNRGDDEGEPFVAFEITESS
jgi:HK97 family phage major capsid protein